MFLAGETYATNVSLSLSGHKDKNGEITGGPGGPCCPGGPGGHASPDGHDSFYYLAILLFSSPIKKS